VQPVGLEGRQTKQLRGKTIILVKVVRDRRIGDSTWELEEDMMKSYPYLFPGKSNFRGQKFCYHGECEDLKTSRLE